MKLTTWLPGRRLRGRYRPHMPFAVAVGLDEGREWSGCAGHRAAGAVREEAGSLRLRSRLLLSLGIAVVPWLHRDDHPPEDLHAARLRISMPTALEAFVREQVPGAQRVEFCHNERQMVVRRGWEPIAEGCEAGPGDTVQAY